MTEAIAQITEYIESSECDLCAKDSELVVVSFRTAFPSGSQVCFACLKKLVLVDHKHRLRANNPNRTKKKETKHVVDSAGN